MRHSHQSEQQNNKICRIDFDYYRYKHHKHKHNIINSYHNVQTLIVDDVEKRSTTWDTNGILSLSAVHQSAAAAGKQANGKDSRLRHGWIIIHEHRTVLHSWKGNNSFRPNKPDEPSCSYCLVLCRPFVEDASSWVREANAYLYTWLAIFSHCFPLQAPPFHRTTHTKCAFLSPNFRFNLFLALPHLPYVRPKRKSAPTLPFSLPQNIDIVIVGWGCCCCIRQWNGLHSLSILQGPYKNNRSHTHSA